MLVALAASLRSPWDLVLGVLIGIRDPGRVGRVDTARWDSLARPGPRFRTPLLLRELAGP